MKGEFRQVFFLALFGFLCCVFVFWVPWGVAPKSSQNAKTWSGVEMHSAEKENTDFWAEFSGSLQVWIEDEQLLPAISQLISGFQAYYPWNVLLLTWVLKKWEVPDIKLSAYSSLGDSLAPPLQLSQDIRPYFLTGIHEILNQSWFLPFAINPLLAYRLAQDEDTSDMLVDWQNRRAKRPWASFLFGKVQTGTLFAQNLALALMKQDFVKYNDTAAFQERLMMQMQPTMREKLLALSVQLECRQDLMKCLMKRGLVNYGFGRYADKQKDAELQLIPYPYAYRDTPVMVYGFQIDDAAKNRLQAQTFLSFYLQYSTEKLASLLAEIQMLSPWKEVFEKNCALWCHSDFSIIDTQDLHYLEQRFEDKLFQKLEEKKLKPDLYLERVSV